MPAGGQNLIKVAPGDVFGPFVAVRPLPSDVYGQRWEFRCRCGELVPRGVAQLRSKLKRGENLVGCQRCNAKRKSRDCRARGTGYRLLRGKYGERRAIELGARHELDVDELPDEDSAKEFIRDWDWEGEL